MSGRLLRPKFITRRDLRASPDTLFVFGDNMARCGLAGQAREMRGEPNAIGVPTKWAPGSQPRHFFADRDLPLVKHAIDAAFLRAAEALSDGRDVVLSADGLGTGLAYLPTRAPVIFALIERHIAELEALGARP